MAEIVNLRQARKQKSRAEKERVAEQNRVLHGRAKAARRRDEALAGQQARFLDGHRREGHGRPDAPPDLRPDLRPDDEPGA